MRFAICATSGAGRIIGLHPDEVRGCEGNVTNGARRTKWRDGRNARDMGSMSNR